MKYKVLTASNNNPVNLACRNELLLINRQAHNNLLVLVVKLGIYSPAENKTIISCYFDLSVLKVAHDWHSKSVNCRVQSTEYRNVVALASSRV